MREGNLESYHAPLSFVILFGVTFAICKIAFSLLAAGLFRSGDFPDLLRNRRLGRKNAAAMSLFRWSPRIAQYPGLREIPPSQWEKESRIWAGAQLRTGIAFP